ncbi:MAG TPA: DUF3105 domain-containing protein [Candidatus Binatia bacterium]|nr:DUF3105 domain-containing protein [Candidatus Binatia bacterium]
MAKRRTSGIQRRERASSDALNRRLDERSGPALPDWRLLAIGGVLLVGTIIVVLVLVSGASGASSTSGTIQPDDGTVHVTQGIDCRSPANSAALTECGGPDPYSSVPAASGPHWPPSAIANWGVYSTPQAETQVIHNLEHGGIVIWYDPAAVEPAEVDALTQYVNTQTASGVGGRFKFILSPWGADVPLGSPVVASAWRYLLPLESADVDAIDAFARARYGRSPEPNGGPGPPGA